MRFAVGAILLMAATADAFAVNPTLQLQQKLSSSSSHSTYFSQRSNNNNSNNIITRYNSLRDLLGTPDDRNHEISSNENKPQINDSTNDSSIIDDTSNADNFNNMLHPQRRNFQGRPSQDSGRLSHDNDELGLNNDRLQPFSFAGQIAKENTRVKKQMGQTPSSASSKSVVVDTEKVRDGGVDGTTNTVRANDFNNMIGIAYSKKSSSFTSNRNPATQQNSSKDVDLETGMHRDKISTFSFSSQNTKSAFLGGAVSGSNGGSSLREATWASKSNGSSGGDGDGGSLGSSGVVVEDDDDEEFTIGGESKEERQKRMKEEVLMNAASTADDTAELPVTPVDPAMNVDNFHNMINVDMSRNAGLRRLISPRTDGQVNHADRMETFSLLSTEDENDGSSNLAPETLEVNHGDRMGTFSFASSSSSSGGGATKRPKLQQVAAAAAAPVFQTEESKSKLAAADNNTTPPPKDNDLVTPNNKSLDTRSQVYSAPQKGSLSSLASSLKTHSRADRIKEIQIRTDPKLLHPDGMNVPRLNARGDVMSMSSTTGRMNVFERIEADLANKIVQDDLANQIVQDDDDGGDEIVAEKDSNSDESVANDEEEKDSDEKEDTVGKAGEGSGNDDNSLNVADGSDDLDQNLERRDCFIGFDLGTSGARMSIVEKTSAGHFDEVVTEALAWDSNLIFDDGNDWRKAIDMLLSRAKGMEVMDRVKAICVSGTSATCLLVKRHSLDVSRKARMYNFDVKGGSSPAVENVMELIDKYVPDKHTARATTGTLAKLLLWSEEQSLSDEVLCHQSDFVSLSLMYEGLNDEVDITTHCDFHNILKLGYDVRELEYPSWMMKLLKEGANIPNPEDVLPSKVVSPGEPIGVISPVVASKYGLSNDVVLVGGTTDSNAAFFAAAGANPEYGTAVTSLGSTLAIKQLSSTYVEDASRGVYSHRFPRFGGSDGEESDNEEEAWLIGGASNVGCAVLRAEDFSTEELSSLSLEIDPNEDSPLSYYPLIKTGERFPVADSSKEPVLSPKPDSRTEYLHGILQGIGDVERDGFKVLGELGATPKLPKVVLSCGGGSKNDMWIAMRQRRLKEIYGDDSDDVVVKRATNTEASYGAALLAAATFDS
mmetsp:Transcript_17263/g.26506  ORF Transcript_17263/g.26506 Transcript_17263/m.26506 type:complete len:1112 (-) Transcript_17263:25-3360(-)